MCPNTIIRRTGDATTVLLEGPYGCPSIDIEGPRYKAFVLVAGGIGVTPMLSIAADLMDQRSRGRPLAKLHLVWAMRDPAMLEAVRHPPSTPDEVRVGGRKTCT